ncbi:hypothetical protein GGQ22_13455 [Nocardioides sp. zg-579]|uniref:Endonuclease/exonuclease/phosphatase domain-containing protein n=1 Tax=Nocardioides marmotae TaxID=2663857 RepID=A0A6I3JDE6_9ACTN|nr:endonuclease/exonuclease/phosphatase family protein [Nocardioides marmotae]MCR6032440.1 hypothetical protein [Gordonia jinghuaiqii]MTB96089.1 hypothetical protein [Nocardioides marmotae]QKD99829.1 endonuclease/exonuclease/phosphatase family protein [Nocardioides marmotae]
MRVRTAALTALVVLLLVVPGLAAPAGATGASGASGAPAAAAAAAPLRATYRLQVVTANLDGAEHRRSGDKLATVQRVIGSSTPDVVMLQEVCFGQFRRFVAANRAWIGDGETWRDHFRFQQLRRHHGCGRPGAVQRHGLVLASRHPLSDVGTHRLPNPGARTPHRFRMLCADVAVRGALLRFADDAVRACTLQLRAGRGRRTGAGPARRAQAIAARKVLAPLVREDRAAVVLGGDFNAVPTKGTMSELYRLSRSGWLTNRRGLFFEADQTGTYRDRPAGAGPGIEQVVCRLAPRVCRWGEPTHRSRGRSRKIDYLFFGENRAEPTATSTLLGPREHLGGDVVRSPSATHDVYLGWADLALDLR